VGVASRGQIVRKDSNSDTPVDYAVTACAIHIDYEEGTTLSAVFPLRKFCTEQMIVLLRTLSACNRATMQTHNQ